MMKMSIVFAMAFGCLLSVPTVSAQSSVPKATPADAAAPAGATGQCKDGSYTSNASKRGACRGHQGVKAWYAAAHASSKAAAAPAAAVAPTKKTAAAATAAVPGGGPGMVWVNSSSKIYHCPGDKWYGKTKHGQYMSEADAKAKGNHPEHGKACSP